MNSSRNVLSFIMHLLVLLIVVGLSMQLLVLTVGGREASANTCESVDATVQKD